MKSITNLVRSPHGRHGILNLVVRSKFTAADGVRGPLEILNLVFDSNSKHIDLVNCTEVKKPIYPNIYLLKLAS
eukprot:SAG31_NODE_1795_length_7248_cov_682.054833_6_plen_74_part_00